jgi:signal transduction histidine kinase
MPARGSAPRGGLPPRGKSAAGGPRRRRFALRDTRIRAKLGVILVIPILAIVSLTGVRLIDSGKRALAAQLVASLSSLSSDLADATHELQRERTVAAQVLAGEPGAAAEYSRQVKVTKAAAGSYAAHRSKVNRMPGILRDRLDRIDQQLSTLDALRGQVSGGQGISISEVVVRYGVVIDDMVGYHNEVVQFTPDAHLSDSIRAVAAFAQAKAATSQEQAIGYAALKSGHLDQQQYSSFLATLTGQEAALRAFDVSATPEQAELVGHTITGDAVQLADQIAQQVGRSVGPDVIPQVSARDLASAVGAVVDLMRWAEQRLDAELVMDAKALQGSVVREVVVESILVLLAIALAIAVAFALARALSRSLSMLREGAMAVVGKELPNAVARLRDLRDIGESTPDQIVATLQDPVRIDSRDEIGQVAQAFNAVHREAVRVAAEQAALRTSVSAMFLNLARRSQALVDRMIGELDTIERGEEDPKRLAQLFQLDHLATRMRRNDENLLVLAGADSSSPRRENALLADVLRAAQSEVELYNRIEFGVVDLDVSVISHAVNDVVRLIAELFDNATRFSPPDSTVVADGRRIGDYVLIQIEDRGLGMSAEQLDSLNERLAEPPTVDVASFRMMGLAVVSRLASRYRIKVELRPNPEGGTVTSVTLPTGILVLPRLRGREPVITRQRSPLAVEQAMARAGAGWPMPQLPGLAAGTGAPAGVITVDRPAYDLASDDPLGYPAQPHVQPDTNEMPPIYRSMEASWPVAEQPQTRSAHQWAPPTATNAGRPPAGSSPAGSSPAGPMAGPPSGGGGRPSAGPAAPQQSPAQPGPPQQGPPQQPPLPKRPVRQQSAPPGAPASPNTPPLAPAAARPYVPGSDKPYVPPAAERPPVPPEPSTWSSSADDGWRAAQAAANPPTAGTTRSGLPKRVPSAQLVPGAVDARTTTARSKRTPDEVRGLLSAYHRGVQRGRSGGEGSSLRPRPDTEESH